jgi:hypothetical protein
LDLKIDIKLNHYILVKKPVTPASKGGVILAMHIVYMDPFFITNLNHETTSKGNLIKTEFAKWKEPVIT